MCEKCGHDHNLDQLCTNSLCIICGLGGDLTSMPCDPQRKKEIEELLQQEVSWRKACKKPVLVQYREVEKKTLIRRKCIDEAKGEFKEIWGEVIETLEGNVEGHVGEHYIIKGVEGELYPIRQEIFEKTYDTAGYCWRDPSKPCSVWKCCYDAGCQAIFDYWKYASGPEWHKKLEEELAKCQSARDHTT